jgi:hypothetical protein
MAGRGDIKAGSAFVELFLKDKLKGPLGLAIGGATTAIASFSAVALHHFMEVGSALNDMSARTGVSTDNLQHWIFAAKQSGASAEDLETALRKMAKGGFNVADFERIGQAIARIEDPTQRAAKAMEVFGKGGTKLLPMLMELQQLKAASIALGPILTPEEVKAADRLGDSFSAMTEALSRATLQVGKQMVPALQTMLEIAVGISIEFNKWMKTKSIEGIGNSVWQARPKTGPAGAVFNLFDPEGPLKGLQQEGAAAIEGGTNKNRGVPDLIESAKQRQAQAEEREKARGKILQDQAKLREQTQRRIGQLIEESLTPQEQFARKEREILDLMFSLNAAKLSGLFDPNMLNRENAGLMTALFRLRAEEAERRAKLGGKPGMEKEAQRLKMPEPTLVEIKAGGSFSAAGAAALSFGGGAGGVQSQMLAEIRAAKKIAKDALTEHRRANELARKGHGLV